MSAGIQHGLRLLFHGTLSSLSTPSRTPSFVPSRKVLTFMSKPPTNCEMPIQQPRLGLPVLNVRYFCDTVCTCSAFLTHRQLNHLSLRKHSCPQVFYRTTRGRGTPILVYIVNLWFQFPSRVKQDVTGILSHAPVIYVLCYCLLCSSSDEYSIAERCPVSTHSCET